MKTRLRIVGISLFVFLMATVSSAGIKFSIVGDADYNQFRSGTAQGGLTFGAGGLMELKMGMFYSLEVGMIYLKRNIGGAPAGTYGDIPIELRISLLRSISFGLGAFYEMPLDSSATSFYGATGDIRILFPFSPVTAFFIEPRYSMDLKNSSGNQMNFISALAGLRVGL